MQLANTEESEYVSIEIIQDLDGGWCFVEQHLSSAAEYLDVSPVFRERLDDSVRDLAFPSDVRERAFHLEVCSESFFAEWTDERSSETDRIGAFDQVIRRRKSVKAASLVARAHEWVLLYPTSRRDHGILLGITETEDGIGAVWRD
jgi:hypothetical protein